MRRIDGIKKTTDNRFLNMYELDMKSDENKHSKYFVASRAETIEDLKISTRQNKADGVIIYSVYREKETKEEKLVLIRQYRCSIDDYIYEFPAGLVDEGEDFKDAGKRELKEETGLDFEPIDAEDMYTEPRFTTIGMTDESCGTVYGYASGQISKEGQEETEEIDIVLADRAEVRRILREEKVAIMCAYMLMHFLNTAEGHVFDFLHASKEEVELTAEQEAKKKNDELIDRLVAYRKRLRMTQQDVADITGIKRANIARLERKVFVASSESLIKYARSVGYELRLELSDTNVPETKK